MEDPDAPSGTFVHWTVYGIAPSVRRFDAGKVPNGAEQGENSFGDDGYGGPCPPEGDDPHHYVFTLYALKDASALPAGAKPDDVRAKLAGAVARGTFTGTYARG